MEAQGTLFKGFQFNDPALFATTESFMYAINFGDGSPVVWKNLGSFAAPFKLNVLIVQSLCSSGNTCAFVNTLRNNLLALDIVRTVDAFNFFPFSAPPMTLLRGYDVIVYAVNFGTSGLAWDTTRRTMGDNFATFLEEATAPGVRRGVVTMLGAYTGNFPPGTNNFVLLGRYAESDYGAFEIAPFRQSAAILGPIVDDDHDALFGVRPGFVTTIVHDGDMAPTVGGLGIAAGRNGVLIADWDDAASAFGAKELNNGRKTAATGAFGSVSGDDARALLRGALGWAAGGMAIPRIKGFQHVFGDNGLFTVEFMALDDDMGYVWDPATNAPRQVRDDAQMASRFVTVTVDNVDPNILSIEAYLAGEVCVRISGTVGNSVTAEVFTDGAATLTLGVTRSAASPSPRDDDDDDDDDDEPAPTETCGVLLVDVTAPHSYSARLTYSGPNGGSNRVWLVIKPWRDPVSSGYGSATYRYRFDATTASVVDQPLPTLKGDLFDGGRGAKVDFIAEASDVGTDDLAFFWSWGSLNDIAYAPLLSRSVYTIHVHPNNGGPSTEGTLAGPQYLGFSEPYFNRAANTGLSALGTINFRVFDSAVHAFSGGASGDDDDDDDDWGDGGSSSSQQMYYVMLLVLDDDNTRGYPSPYLNDGIDMEFIVLDLSGPTSNHDDDDDDWDDDDDD
jgi:hypothetical protein